MSNNSRTANWTFLNNANSVTNGNELLVGAGMMILTVEINNAGLNTLVFEGKSTTGTTYYPWLGFNCTDKSMSTSTTSDNVMYQFSLEGLTAFRIRISNYSTGTVSVSGTIVN